VAENWDTYIPHKLGDTSADYARWRAEVLAVRDMSESRLRKLWKANFSPADIAADKHWAMFPPNPPNRKHIAPGTPQEAKQGRTIGDKKINWIYARALQQAAQSILAFYRLEPAALERTRKQLAEYTDLVKKFSHKGS
jgi:hypothetical protein